ncbi:MAG: hypothetical protein WAT53_10505 [Nitrosomonas sp.]
MHSGAALRSRKLKQHYLSGCGSSTSPALVDLPLSLKWKRLWLDWPGVLINTAPIMFNRKQILLLLIMLWLPVEGTMAAVISLCANLRALESAERLLKQGITVSVNNQYSLLKCGQDGSSSGRADLTTDVDVMLHVQDSHNPPQHTAINDESSNFQCNDLLCKISYVALVFSSVVSVSQNDQANIVFPATEFTSHVPKQSYRPPIV